MKACASDGVAGMKEYSVNTLNAGTRQMSRALETPVSHFDVMLSVANQYVDTFLPDNGNDLTSLSTPRRHLITARLISRRLHQIIGCVNMSLTLEGFVYSIAIAVQNKLQYTTRKLCYRKDDRVIARYISRS